MALSKKHAKRRATIYRRCPPIPRRMRGRFPGWTHCTIRAYRENSTFYQKIAGKKVKRKSRYVEGYIFIYLTRRDGTTLHRPIQQFYVVRDDKMTHHDFMRYVHEIAVNSNKALFHALA